MKKIAIIGLLIVTLTMAFMPAVPAQAAVTQNIKAPMSMQVLVPCTGEIIILQGILHTLVTLTQDSNGGLHVSAHFQPQKLKGVGQTTGDKYIGVGVSRDNTNDRAPLQSEYTYVNNFRIIGTGKDAVRYMVHQTIHLAVNANGVATANITNARITCE